MRGTRQDGMMTMSEVGTNHLLEHLYEALPVIARITGGYATVTDRQGRRLKSVDSHGSEIPDFLGKVYEIAAEAGEKQHPIVGVSQFRQDAEAWAIPIGDYVLSCSNVERVERDTRLRESLTKALPLIAKVAGGEAVLFDSEGIRLQSVDHNGVQNDRFIGKVSKASLEAMQTQEPVFGASMSVQGAIAVRIPITQKYGLGFNNEVMVSRKQKLIDEVKKFQYAKYNLHDIIGESEAIKRCKKMIKHVANGVSSVLIFGDTGTGKELFAQAIHNASERRDMPFIAINCGALPPSLIESNLFGYAEGSFTGAKKGGVKGIFEEANGGTVFLDEISEMDWDLQAKLLRVLQEREVVPIGSTKPVAISVRVVASTNKSLQQLMAEGKFREDLYYRINVVDIRVPSLKERREDIPLLTRFFVGKFNKLLGKNVQHVDDKVNAIFSSYSWPGNVRELQNTVERALNMVGFEETVLERHHLPAAFTAESGIASFQLTEEAADLASVVKNVEKQVITRTLREQGGSRTGTARKLGLSIATLWRKMKEYDIEE